MDIGFSGEKNLNMVYGKTFACLMLIVMALSLASKDFLMYHSIVELFVITVGFVMSIISINTYKLQKDRRIIFLGIAFGIISVLHFLYFATYGETYFIKSYSFNVSLKLWVAGSYLQSISFLICFTSKTKEYNLKKIFWAYSSILIVIITSILYLDIFPDCYIEGMGFTTFKIISGYANTIILIVSLGYLIKNKNDDSKKTDTSLMVTLVACMISEISFALIKDGVNTFTVLGYLFQFISFYFIYVASIKSSLRDPHYDLIKLNEVLIEKNKKLEDLVDSLKSQYDYRKMIESEERKKGQILNSILESVLEGILVVNDDGKIVHVNQKFLDMLNIPSEIKPNVKNEQLIRLLKEQIINSEEFEKGIEQEWQSAKEHIKHVYFKNGKVFKVSSVPFCDNQELSGKLIVYRDITEKRKIEKLKKEIEVSEASLEKAKEYDELKTNFFCTVSHELKTPINIILGVIQLLSRVKEDDLDFIKRFSSHKYMNVMKQNCYRLIKLSNNLIDITKIDAGYAEMKFKNRDVISVIENITLSVADYIKSNDISLIFDTDVEERIIACDAEQLERVMLNLLSNAVKFTEAQGSITVNIVNEEDCLLISVKDSGIGIPEDKREIVFDRFRRVDSTLRRPKEGSGIGLALVKSIVEKHEGHISLDSKLGEGSEFIIQLPVKTMEDSSRVTISDQEEMNVDRINIEFSDIYELNTY